MRRWRRFAINRMKVGRKMRTFKSLPIPAEVYMKVSAGIEAAKTVEEVRRVFDEALAGLQGGQGEARDTGKEARSSVGAPGNEFPRLRTVMSAGSGQMRMFNPVPIALRCPVI